MSQNTEKNINDFIEDRTTRPGGRPNNQGIVQRAKFSIEEFQDNCSTIRMTYVQRKGQENVYLDINLAPEPFADLVNAIEDCAKNREFKDYTIEEARGKDRITHASITVHRGQDNIVCMTIESKGNKETLQFLPVDNYPRKHAGQDLPVMIKSERNARACARIYSGYLDVLRERYKPFVFQQGGGNNGGYNKPYNRPSNNNNSGGYTPPAPQNQQPATVSDDDFFG